MQFSAIKTALLNRLNISNYVSFTGGETYVGETINTAVHKLARERMVESSAYITLTANQREELLPADAFWIRSVEITDGDGNTRILAGRDMIDLHGEDPGWKDDDAGTPRQFYFRSGRIIGFDPKPAGGETCRVYYWEIPDDLSNATDSNDLTLWFFDAVIELALVPLMKTLHDERYESQVRDADRMERKGRKWARSSKGRQPGFKVPLFRTWRKNYG